MIAMDELLAAAHARGSRQAPAAANEYACGQPLTDAHSMPQVLAVEEQAAALWSWVQGKDTAQRWERPWTKERVADAHTKRRRNAGRSGGISGSAWVSNSSSPRLSILDRGHAIERVERRPATAGVRRRRPPELTAEVALQPIRPVARSRRRRGENAALLAGIPADVAVGVWENPTLGRPLASRPQSAGPVAKGSRSAVACMHVNSGWMWGAFEGRYGKEAKRAAKIIQRRWRAVKQARAVRKEIASLRTAALEVQRRTRGWLAKRECARRRQHDKEVWAALRIQIAWRGRCGRQVAEGVRAKQNAEQLAIATESARRIQRVWRGRHTRKEMAPWLREARVIRDRQSAEELAAAARIEAMRRTRRMAEARRRRLEQARLRRKHTPTMREATSFLKQSVACRQFTQWKARQERRKVAMAGAGAGSADPTSTKGVAQAVIRSELQLRAAKAERWRRGEAATVIQRWWRPIAKQLQEAREYTAALTLQCGWRALLARRQAAERRRRQAERSAAARAALADELRKLAELEAAALQKLLESGLAKREGVQHVEPFETSKHESEVIETVESMLMTLEATLEPWTAPHVADAASKANAQHSSSIVRVDARTVHEQSQFTAESESYLALERTRRQDEQDRVDLAKVEGLLDTGRALCADCDWDSAIQVLQRAEKLVPHKQVLVAERLSALLEEAEVGLDMEVRRFAFTEAKSLVASAIEAATTPCAPHREAANVRPRLKKRVVETTVDWVESADTSIPTRPQIDREEASSSGRPSFNECYDVWVKNNIQHGYLSEVAMRKRVHLCADPPSCLDLDERYQVSTFIDSTSLTAASFASDSLTFCDGGAADGPAWRAMLSNGETLLTKIEEGASGPFFALPKEQQVVRDVENIPALDLITGSSWRLVNISGEIPDAWQSDEVHSLAQETADALIMASLEECVMLQIPNSGCRSQQALESELVARRQEDELEFGVSGPEEHASVVVSSDVLSVASDGDVSQAAAKLAKREAAVAAREAAVAAREAYLNQQNLQESDATSRTRGPTTAAEWYQHLMHSDALPADAMVSAATTHEPEGNVDTGAQAEAPAVVAELELESEHDVQTGPGSTASEADEDRDTSESAEAPAADVQAEAPAVVAELELESEHDVQTGPGSTASEADEDRDTSESAEAPAADVQAEAPAVVAELVLESEHDVQTGPGSTASEADEDRDTSESAEAPAADVQAEAPAVVAELESEHDVQTGPGSTASEADEDRDTSESAEAPAADVQAEAPAVVAELESEHDVQTGPGSSASEADEDRDTSESAEAPAADVQAEAPAVVAELESEHDVQTGPGSTASEADEDRDTSESAEAPAADVQAEAPAVVAELESEHDVQTGPGSTASEADEDRDTSESAEAPAADVQAEAPAVVAELVLESEHDVQTGPGSSASEADEDRDTSESAEAPAADVQAEAPAVVAELVLESEHDVQTGPGSTASEADEDSSTTASDELSAVVSTDSEAEDSVALFGDGEMVTPVDPRAMVAATDEIQRALMGSQHTFTSLTGTTGTAPASPPGPLYVSLLAEYVEVAPELCEADRDALGRELAALRVMESEAVAQSEEVTLAAGQKQTEEVVSDSASNAAHAAAANIVNNAVDVATDYVASHESSQQVESGMLRPARAQAQVEQQDQQRGRARRVHFAPSPLKARHSPRN